MQSRPGLSAVLSSLQSKLGTLAWFAARPKMYKEAARRILRRQFTTARSATAAQQARAVGIDWCARTASRPEDLLALLGNSSGHFEPIASAEQPRWTRALEQADRIPNMGGPGHVDLLYHLCREIRARRVLETGVAAGWSTLAILLALDRNGDGTRLVSIDMPYPKRANEHLVGAAVPVDLRNRWTLIRRPDRDGLPIAIRSLGTLDLAHYDSDKSHEGRLFAYPLLWASLRLGGILMSDDIEDNLAFREFADRVGRRAYVFAKSAGNYAGVIIK